MNEQNQLRVSRKMRWNLRPALLSVLGLGLAGGAWALRESWAQDRGLRPSTWQPASGVATQATFVPIQANAAQANAARTNASSANGNARLAAPVLASQVPATTVQYIQERVTRRRSDGSLETLFDNRPVPIAKLPAEERWFPAAREESSRFEGRVGKLAEQLGKQLRVEGEDGLDKELVAELQDLLNQQFDERHLQHMQRLDILKLQAQQVAKILEERKQQKSMIVARRFKELLGQRDPLNWDYSPTGTRNGPVAASGDESLRFGFAPSTNFPQNFPNQAFPLNSNDAFFQTPGDFAPNGPPGLPGVAGRSSEMQTGPGLRNGASSLPPGINGTDLRATGFPRRFVGPGEATSGLAGVGSAAQQQPQAPSKPFPVGAGQSTRDSLIVAAGRVVEAIEAYRSAKDLYPTAAISRTEFRNTEIQLSTALSQLKLGMLERETEIARLEDEHENTYERLLSARTRYVQAQKQPTSEQELLKCAEEMQQRQSDVRMSAATVQAAKKRGQIIDEMVSGLGFESLDQLVDDAEALLNDQKSSVKTKANKPDPQSPPADASGATTSEAVGEQSNADSDSESEPNADAL